MFRFSRDPWRELDELRTERNRLFFGTSGRPFFRAMAEHPAINIWKGEDGLIVTAELAGVKPDDVDVTVDTDSLTIRGKYGGEEDEDRTFHRKERLSGSFSRVVQLPYAVDPQHAEASYDNGLLRLKLVRPEEHKPRKVAVKAV